jgi:hypothetical protein
MGKRKKPVTFPVYFRLPSETTTAVVKISAFPRSFSKRRRIAILIAKKTSGMTINTASLETFFSFPAGLEYDNHCKDTAQ